MIRGWVFQSPEGVSRDDVFVPCPEVADYSRAALADAEREGRVFPPLRSCGWDHLGAA